MTKLIITEMNKINFKFLISIFLVTLSLIACKTDEDITQGNHFLYEGKGYDLTQGVFEFSARRLDQTGVYEIEFTLFSSDLTHDFNRGELFGKGYVILFQLYNASKSDLSGTYAFDRNDIANSNTFIKGGVALSFDSMGNNRIPEEQSFDGGTLKIEKLGELYEVSFDCTLKNGKKVTGYYKGEIK